jgi:NAD+ kinase
MQYKRVILSGRSGVPGVEETLNALVAHLQDQSVGIFCTAATVDLITDYRIEVLDENHLAGQIDLVIVVGGDGSLLQAAHFAADQDLPVVGINRGRLGFLTDICPDTLTQIDDILQGSHTMERRYIIDSHLTQDKTDSEPQMALNDVVLFTQGAQMIAFDVFVDEQLVYEHRADGLIIATPTGSTAYALSGGGPILQPQLPALAIVPMFPHTLSSRPIVVNINSKIRIKISPNQRAIPYVSNDGHEGIPVQPGGEIHVNLHEKQLQLLHPKDYNYYRTLREKLNWEQSPRRSTD